MARLEHLPIEIQNMIYTLNLQRDSPILITSPRSDHERSQTLPGAHYGGLLRVNKRIHANSKPVFYALNTFSMGNGCWGSKIEPNCQALGEFIRLVPKDCIASIKRVEAHLFTDSTNWSNRSVVYSTADGLAFQKVAGMTAQVFASVERVDVHLKMMDQQYHPSCIIESPCALLGQLDPLCKGMALLTTCPRLRTVALHNPYNMSCKSFWTLILKWRKILREDGTDADGAAIVLKETDGSD